MSKNNPFAINFGIIPSQYIERNFITDEIITELESDIIQNTCFMLTGVIGAGKTVTLTAIEKEMKLRDEWVVVGLNPDRDMISSLVSKLYDTHEFINKFISTNLNLSKFGIGINLETKSPIADIESALEIILTELKKHKKRLLITVDEVSNTKFMCEFASTYQLLIRQELPVYLIMAGLYHNIHNLENEDNLTFLYRTPKYEMEPLNITMIQQRYSSIFNFDLEKAFEIAAITKGYAFAYQVLGKYMWDSDEKDLTSEVLIRFDEALERYVYDKMWSELSATDKWYLKYIATKEKMETSELLSLTNKKQNEFAQYRARLRDKGILNVTTFGEIRMKLPRFNEFVKKRVILEGI